MTARKINALIASANRAGNLRCRIPMDRMGIPNNSRNDVHTASNREPDLGAMFPEINSDLTTRVPKSHHHNVPAPK